jgi:hypothetical protein
VSASTAWSPALACDAGTQLLMLQGWLTSHDMPSPYHVCRDLMQHQLWLHVGSWSHACHHM